MAEENYIRNLQKTIADRKSAESAAIEKENRDAEIVSTQSPNDWKSLKSWLRETVSQISSEDVTCSEKGIDSIEIAYRTQGNIKRTVVTYHGKLAFLTRITVENSSSSDFSFRPEVQGRKVVWHLSEDDHQVFDIDGMGKEIIKEALK